MLRYVIALLFAGCCFSQSLVAPAAQDRAVRFASAASERAAADELRVDRLARYLRIQIYELYRLDRAEYNRRLGELQQRVDAWRQSDRDAEETRELVDWLNGSLGGVDRPVQRVAEPVEPLPTPREPRAVERPSLASPPISAELAPSFSAENADDASNDLPRHAALKPEIDATAPPLPGDISIDPTQQGTVAEPTAPRLSSADQPAAAGSTVGGARSTIDDLVNRVEQFAPISKLPSSVPPPVTLPELADVPDAPPFVSPAFAPKTVPSVNIEVPKIGGLAEMRGTALRPGGKSATSSGGETRVNFTEIAALVRGYNVALRELETKLSNDTAWTADTLEPVVDDLEDLARRREDLGLYENALPAVERSQLAGRDSLDEAIRLTGKRIAEVRKGLTGSADTESAAATRRDLEELDGFSRRLAALAGGKER